MTAIDAPANSLDNPNTEKNAAEAATLPVASIIKNKNNLLSLMVFNNLPQVQSDFPISLTQFSFRL